MSRRKSRNGGSRTTSGAARQAGGVDGRRDDRPSDDVDWADEAAQARSADDPRAMTPHDATGAPSTGDRPGKPLGVRPSTGRNAQSE